MSKNEIAKIKETIEKMKIDYAVYRDNYLNAVELLTGKEFIGTGDEVIASKISSALKNFEFRLEDIGYVIMNMEVANEFGDIQVGKEE